MYHQCFCFALILKSFFYPALAFRCLYLCRAVETTIGVSTGQGRKTISKYILKKNLNFYCQFVWHPSFLRAVKLKVDDHEIA